VFIRASGLARHRRRIVSTLLATVALLTGCLEDAVEWGDVSYRTSRLGDPPAISARRDADLPTIAGAVGHCRSSVTSVGVRGALFRAWWSVRSDSNAVLSLQQSPDNGQTWQPPLEVDTRDRGGRGCDRPAPGVWYDPASRYVYLAYFLDALDGSGVFFAHSMDEGRMFHSPVAVVYGNRPAHASVVGRGDSVVVVFEDPNAMTPTLGYALSRTTGHIFEQRGLVTPEDVHAIWPWVVLDHNRISVWWMTPEADRVGHREGIWK
jgi:hypothetical protein